jgi:polysaccharide biosynthesis protein PslL
MHTRHRYLDVAKGLGILLVVFGHNRIVGPEHPQIFSLIFSFHMPLFIFVSGMTFRNDIALPELARRRWYTLLRPYFFTLLLVSAAFFVVKYRFDLQQLGLTLMKLLYGTGRALPWQWLWFLPLLFLINMAYAVTLRILPDTPSARALIMSAFLVGGVLFARALWQYPTPLGPLVGLPFNADLLGIGVFYYWLGHEFGQRHEGWEQRLRTWAPVFIAAFAGLHWLSDVTMDLNYRRYDHIFLVTAMALLGIACVLAISQLLVRHAGERVVQALEYVGSRTLVIFIFHVFLQAKALFVAVEILHLSYWPASVLAWIGGVVAPLLLGELVLRRLPVLRDVYFPTAARTPRSVQAT